MMDYMPGPDPAGEQIYLRKSHAASRAVWFYLGAGGFFLMAFLGFVFALLLDMGPLRVQLSTTVPILVGLGLTIHARSLSRAPEMIRVGPHGVTIQGTQSVRLHRWEQMGWARVDMQPMSAKRHLIIYDVGGKALTKISDVFDDFDDLADKVINGIVERDQDTAGVIQNKKGRRNAVLMASVSTALLVGAVFLASSAYESRRSERLFSEQAVDGEAEIVRRFVAPNGITKRLEYRVTESDGSTATRNAELTSTYWESLEGATTVPVRYVPGEPGISRLRDGEVAQSDPMESPTVMFVLAGLAGVMCLFFYVAAALSWKGWDIDLDSKTHKLSIKRFGTGR